MMKALTVHDSCYSFPSKHTNLFGCHSPFLPNLLVLLSGSHSSSSLKGLWTERTGQVFLGTPANLVLSKKQIRSVVSPYP